jgi:hypothetical protein
LYDDGQSLLAENEQWKRDAGELQNQLEEVVNGVQNDKPTLELVDALEDLGNSLATAGQIGFGSLKVDGQGLYRDFVDVMVPRLISLIHEIPVPRVEFKSEGELLFFGPLLHTDHTQTSTWLLTTSTLSLSRSFLIPSELSSTMTSDSLKAMLLVSIQSDKQTRGGPLIDHYRRLRIRCHSTTPSRGSPLLRFQHCLLDVQEDRFHAIPRLWYP